MREITAKYPSYSDLVDSMEVENLLQVDDNDYQGDTRILVRDGGRFGLLFFGWGSCSGCDALQAVEGSHAELIELRDDLWNSIHWEDSAAALIAYLDGKDWTLDYHGRDEASIAFRSRARAILVDAVAGRVVVAGAQRKAIEG